VRRFSWRAPYAAVCIVALLLCAGPAFARLYLGAPAEEWVEQKAEPPLSHFYYLVKNEKIAAEFRAVEEKIRIRLTPQAYLKLVQHNSLRSSFKNYVPGGTTEVAVAGKKAARHDFTFTVTNGNSLRGRAYCFLDGNTGYSLLFVALEDSFDALAADLEAFLAGISVGDEPPAAPTPVAGPTPTPQPEMTIPELPIVTPRPDRPAA
jgi:hypothetical protein